MPLHPVMPTQARTSATVASLAANLRRIILAKPEGALIGKENALCAELDCSRGTLRQASRQLELQGLLYIRRGPAGGYFGARPEMEAIIDIAALYFVSRQTKLEEALRSVMMCTVESARLAAACPHDSACYRTMRELYQELRPKYPEDMGTNEFIRDEERIDEAIFAMIDAAPLELFIKILNRFSLAEFADELFVRQPQRRMQYRTVRLETMKAILDHDQNAAAKSMMEVHSLIYEWLPSGKRASPVAALAALG